MRSSKNDDLKVFRQVFENLFCIWTDIYTSFNYLPCWEFNRKLDIMRWCETIITMDQRLIQIEYDTFPVLFSFLNWHVHLSSTNLLVVWKLGFLQYTQNMERS